MLAEAVDELLAMILTCASSRRTTGSIFVRRVISTMRSLMISIMLFFMTTNVPTRTACSTRTAYGPTLSVKETHWVDGFNSVIRV
jgi:hypothetical protein